MGRLIKETIARQFWKLESRWMNGNYLSIAEKFPF